MVTMVTVQLVTMVTVQLFAMVTVVSYHGCSSWLPWLQ